MVTAFESLFPGLTGTTYHITSPANDVYNCIAWAAGRASEWWWPFDAPGSYCPPGVAKEETIPAFQAVFAALEYSVCDNAEMESGFEKIALFADALLIPTHVARQLPNDRWTSKLGKLEDIEHDLPALVGDEYGSVVMVMRRPLLQQQPSP